MHPNCLKCKLDRQCLNPRITGRGNIDTPKIIMIGEAPGRDEDFEGQVFIGRAGELLTSMLGDKLPFVWITNGVRCLAGHTRILTDQGVKRLNWIVKNKFDGRVLSVDEGNNLVWKKIIGYYRSPLAGRKTYWLRFVFDGDHKRRVGSLVATEEHKILTKRGYVEVKNLRGDDLVATGTPDLDEVSYQVLLGSVLGDGCFSKYSYSESHGLNQKDYVFYKANIFRNFNSRIIYVKSKASNGKIYDLIRFYLKKSISLIDFYNKWYKDGKKIYSIEELEKVNLLGLAVWYMDDGHWRYKTLDGRYRKKISKNLNAVYVELTLGKIEKKYANRLVNMLKNKGYFVNLKLSEGKYYRIKFKYGEGIKFLKDIAPYIIPEMRDKLPEELRNIEYKKLDVTTKTFWNKVEKKEIKIRRDGNDLMYCIDVEDTHNFVTSAGVVHNCTPYKDPFNKRMGIRPPTEYEIELCRPFLLKELKAFDPSRVILMPMGKIAYYGLFGENPPGGIVQASGIEKKVKIGDLEFRVIPNIHPAYVLRNPEMRSKFEGVLNYAFNNKKEAYEESDWKILRPEEGIEKLQWILDNKDKVTHVIIDLETTSFDPWHTEIIMVNFSHHLDHTAYALPLRVTNYVHHADYPYEILTIDWDVTSEQCAQIKSLVSRMVNEIPLVGANIKYDLKCLVLQKWIKNLNQVRILDDTMILTHLIYNQRLGNLKLKDCCKTLFDIKDDWDKKIESYLERFRQVKDRVFSNIPTSVLGEYGALDAFYTRKLHDHLIENLPDKLRHLREFMMPLVLIIAEAEMSGWILDTDMYEFLFQKYGDMIAEVSKKIRSFDSIKKYIVAKLLVLSDQNSKKRKKWGSEQMEEMAFNISSPKQLSDIMYGPKFFNLPIIKRTEKGAASTNYETLVALKKEKLDENQTGFITELLDFRTLNKLKTTYVDPVLDHVVEGSYKPDFIIPGTTTGRLCLTGDTKVSLLNGKEVRIDELPVNEKFYLYGCEENGEIVPIEAISMGETKKVTSIVEVLLDNDEIVRCTLDHKFMLRDGTYKEAQYLTSNDSLMPLYRKVSNNNRHQEGYELYLNNKTGGWKFTHSMVGKIVPGIKEAHERCPGEKLVVHHKNFYKRNNDPKNLEWMGSKEHIIYHDTIRLKNGDNYFVSEEGREWSKKRQLDRWSDPKLKDELMKMVQMGSEANQEKLRNDEEYRKRMVEVGKENIKLLQTPEMRKIAIEASILVNSKRWKELWETDEWRDSCIKQITERWNDEEYRNKMINVAKETIKKQWEDPEWAEKSRLAAIKCGTEVSNRIVNKSCNKCGRIFVKQPAYSGHIGYCLNDNHRKQQSKWATNTLNKIVNKPCPKCGKIFEKQAAYNGHIGNCKHNHKIVSLKIINLEIPIPVYDLCSPITNNFALSAGVFVHNSSGFHTLPRGSDIKRMYTSRWRDIGGLIMSGDMSQLELRILAALACETKMIEAFIAGVDIHAMTAGEIFIKAWNEVSKNERNIGKTTNFAIIYGKTAMTLKDDLQVTIQRAQEIIDNLLSGYDQVDKWMKDRHKEVLSKGYVETVFGREIPIPEVYMEKKNFQSEALRKSVNFPIQSTASDLVKSSLCRYYKKLKDLKLQTKFLGETHDALNNDLYPGDFFIILNILKQSCENENMEIYKDWLICPVRIDVSLGTSMGSVIGFEIKELSEDFVLLEGEGMRRDWEHLIEIGSKGYRMKFYLDEETPIDSSSYMIEQVIRDSVKWSGKLKIKQK